MSIYQLNFEGKNKIEVAIERLQQYEPPESYWLAFSGGKDSVVIYDLAVKSGVKFTAHYSVTGIDPPEVVQFMRRNYPALTLDFPRKSIWRWIEHHGMPLRQARWCCGHLKELHGIGWCLVTGVRWAESPRRKSRSLFEGGKTRKEYTGVDYNVKEFLHPIIDWSTREVWEYIRERDLPYCCLYDEGFHRLGCILCPMKTAKQTQIELSRWPKIAEAWQRACFRWFANHPGGNHTEPESYWQWWLSRKGFRRQSNQYSLFE